ncbi:MAG TPA: hypothetical protein VGN37_08555 [Actinocatenispora sp.]
MRSNRQLVFGACILVVCAVLGAVALLSKLDGGDNRRSAASEPPAATAPAGGNQAPAMPALPWSEQELRSAYARAHVFVDLFANVRADDQVPDRISQLKQYVDPPSVPSVLRQYTEQRELTKDGGNATYSVITARWRLVAQNQVSLVVDGSLAITHGSRTSEAQASFAVDLKRAGAGWAITWIGDPNAADAGIPANG